MKNSQDHCSFTERLVVVLGSEDGHTETHQDEVAVKQAAKNLRTEHKHTDTLNTCEHIGVY